MSISMSTIAIVLPNEWDASMVRNFFAEELKDDEVKFESFMNSVEISFPSSNNQIGEKLVRLMHVPGLYLTWKSG